MSLYHKSHIDRYSLTIHSTVTIDLHIRLLSFADELVITVQTVNIEFPDWRYTFVQTRYLSESRIRSYISAQYYMMELERTATSEYRNCPDRMFRSNKRCFCQQRGDHSEIHLSYEESICAHSTTDTDRLHDGQFSCVRNTFHLFLHPQFLH